MASEKRMYVIYNANYGTFYCGLHYWDKQLRKAKIYHSLKFVRDVLKSYAEENCKILEVTMSIVGEVTDGN